MPVYVDTAQHRYGRMTMCHMLADTVDELHAMADIIGVRRKWYQGHTSTPHYDICKSKRELAIQAGALVITRREVVALVRRLRSEKEQA